jgi:hypothetical protein
MNFYILSDLKIAAGNTAARLIKKFCQRFINKIKSNFIILMVDGGFGSQLNKYFIGQFLEKKLGAEVRYDLSWFDKQAISIDEKDTRNFDLLKIFPEIKFPMASKKEIRKYKKYFYFLNKQPFVYNEEMMQKTAPLYVDGYFGHWKYLKDSGSNIQCKMNLDNPNIKNLDLIKNSINSVAVHIRRGDYINSVHDVLNEEYFINAIKHIKNILQLDVKFFIFSNGVDWVKERIIKNLPKNADYHIFMNNDNSDGIKDFYLMLNCSHQICSNSTFSYFAALLNQNPYKQVIIPETWMGGGDKTYKNHSQSFRYPGWIVMNNAGDVQ